MTPIISCLCNKLLKAIPSAAIVGLTIVAPVHAQQGANAQADLVTPVQFVEDIGASERINFSGKLRMLSQRIVAASCYHQNGVMPDVSLATLQAATAEFVQITDALEFGNPDMGIVGAEEVRRTQVGLSKLRELWAPIQVLADKVAAGDGTNADIAEMALQSEELLEIAKRLVVQISSEYGGQTTVLQKDAVTIDLSGRQRMLSQRISKNICLLAHDINPEISGPELVATATVFDSSLMALRSGMTDVGVQPPPNEDIAAGLDIVINGWSQIKPIVDAKAVGEAADIEQLAIVFEGANQMTGNMNTVVGLYSEASKMGI